MRTGHHSPAPGPERTRCATRKCSQGIADRHQSHAAEAASHRCAQGITQWHQGRSAHDVQDTDALMAHSLAPIRHCRGSDSHMRHAWHQSQDAEAAMHADTQASHWQRHAAEAARHRYAQGIAHWHQSHTAEVTTNRCMRGVAHRRYGCTAEAACMQAPRTTIRAMLQKL